MKPFSTRSLLLVGSSLAATVLVSPAAAQEADENVIVVTAQNRAEDVQDVPIAIDVIGAEAIADAGFANANDLGYIAPAVQVNQDQGTVKITVRGVGTNSNDEAQDTSVVANIDGEYINRPNALGVALFDLERVEVLRGPQGTLYGRNSTGGAINFITRKAGSDFGANVSASYGNYSDLQLNAGIDIPLGDFAAVRGSVFYNDRDGYVSHPAAGTFTGGRSDDNNAVGGRLSLRVGDTSDAFQMNLSGEMARREYTPQSFASVNLNAVGNGPAGPGCNAPGFERVAPAFAQTLCIPSGTTFLDNQNRENYAAPAFGLGLIGQDTWALRGRLSYEFSDALTVTYIGGYRSFSGDDTNFLTLPVIYRNFTFLDEADTQSHELRLNGVIGGGIIYQVGGFYFKEELDREGGFFLPIGPNGSFLSYFGRLVSSESSSVFGQVEVPLGDTFTVIGGLRYTDNSRDAVYKNGGFGFNRNADRFAGIPFADRPAGGPPDPYVFNAGPARKDFDLMLNTQTLNLGSDDDKITWTLGANFTPNADTLLYAKVSTGFKGGGFDAVGSYDPESNLAYEAGAKFSFGESASNIFNVTGFYYDYTDLQVSVLLDTTVGGQTFNAGSATIWGVEADFAYEIIENGVLSLSANYLNAEYNELLSQYNVFTVPGTGADITGVGDLHPNTAGIQQPNFAGNRPGFSPEWVLTGGYQHTFDLGSGGEITAGITSRYKSFYYGNFFNYSDSSQDAFTQTDLTLEWGSEDGLYSVLLFARNLEDTRPLSFGGYTAAGPDDIFNWQFGTPSTYGIRLSFDY